MGGAKCEVQGREMLLALAVGWQASAVGGDKAECLRKVDDVSIVLLMLCSCLAECACKKKSSNSYYTPSGKKKK